MTKFMSEMDVTAHFRKVLEKATGKKLSPLKAKKARGKLGKQTVSSSGTLLTRPSVKLLLETKLVQTSRKQKCDQTYLHRLSTTVRSLKRGDLIPNVIFIGDENHCFALSFASVENFLNAEIDWNRATQQPRPQLES